MNKPEWVRRKGFYLVGIERYTSSGPEAIHRAWDEFLARHGEIRHAAEPEVLYGYEDYTRDFIKNGPAMFPQFYYLAALEVENAEDIPPGMSAKYVPPATYALFRHEGSLADVAGVFHYIYQEWLPASGFDIDPRVMGDFERYPYPIADRDHAVVDIHIPLVPAADPERRRVELVELPELKAAVVRSECSQEGTRSAWAALRESLAGSSLLEETREGFVFIPEWQWSAGVKELWTGVKTISFDGLPEEVEKLELPARLYARITVKGGREQSDGAYSHLNDWFAVSGFIRDAAEGVYGFEANRLDPVNPFDIPANSLDSFHFDVYAPIAGPGIDPVRFPGIEKVEVRRQPSRCIAGVEGFVRQKEGEPAGQAISSLWEELEKRVAYLPELPEMADPIGLLTYDKPFGPQQNFHYLAGFEVGPEWQRPLPEGMTERTIPACSFAVVTFRGQPEDIGQCWEFFHGFWREKSGYEAIDDFECERRFVGFSGDGGEAVVELWFPVRLRGAAPKPLTEARLYDAKAGHELQDMRYARVHMASFKNAELHGIDLRNSSLLHANFVHSEWNHIFFSEVRVNHIQMGGTVFENIKRPDAADSRPDAEAGTAGWVNREPVVFRDSDLSTAIFDNCELVDVDIRNCRLEGMRIDGVPVAKLLEAYRAKASQ